MSSLPPPIDFGLNSKKRIPRGTTEGNGTSPGGHGGPPACHRDQFTHTHLVRDTSSCPPRLFEEQPEPNCEAKPETYYCLLFVICLMSRVSFLLFVIVLVVIVGFPLWGPLGKAANIGFLRTPLDIRQYLTKGPIYLCF